MLMKTKRQLSIITANEHSDLSLVSEEVLALLSMLLSRWAVSAQLEVSIHSGLDPCSFLSTNRSMGSGGGMEGRTCSWKHVKVVVDNFLSNEMFA